MANLEHRLTSVMVLTLAMTLVWVCADVSKSDGAGDDTSSLHQRMDQLELLLRAQAEQLFHQDSSIRQLKATVNDQDSSIRQLRATVNGQDSSIRQLKATVNDQDSSIRQLRATVNGQDSSIRQLKATVNDQDSSIRQLNATINAQDSSIRQLKATVNDQDTLISQLEATVNELQTNERETQNSFDRSRVAPADTDETGNMISSTSHHDVIKVGPRAVDASPLEGVMAQMGQQLTEMTATMDTLVNANNQQDLKIQDALTSTYVHWGSSQCNNSSQLVYSGVVGGSNRRQSGAATNYLCLTTTPVLGDHVIPGGRAYLYGGQYETGDSRHQSNPLCSVCRSSHSSTIMIPGTNVCTPGWQPQYSGVLMAGYYNDPAGSEFICVDSMMDSRARSVRDDDGKLLYYTVTQCGSLPCEPYVTNMVVTCVVCSQ